MQTDKTHSNRDSDLFYTSWVGKFVVSYMSNLKWN